MTGHIGRRHLPGDAGVRPTGEVAGVEDARRAVGVRTAGSTRFGTVAALPGVSWVALAAAHAGPGGEWQR
ncbi:hypothetical protein GCM10009736_06170 [Actinomadura bangladeshensis]